MAEQPCTWRYVSRQQDRLHRVCARAAITLCAAQVRIVLRDVHAKPLRCRDVQPPCGGAARTDRHGQDETQILSGVPAFYRLQVDRQTKSSFEDKSAAEKAAKAIKKPHPVVRVAIYDGESHERVLIEA